jgi:hypothetical protein
MSDSSVNPNDVQVDRCFRTPTNEVRRVTEITKEDCIQYVSRGSRATGPWGPGSNLSHPPTRARFVAEVVEWVRCDWDDRYTNQPPT